METAKAELQDKIRGSDQTAALTQWSVTPFGFRRNFVGFREYRNSIPDRSSGPIKKEYSLYCDIVDESGAIATIATILAAHQISIKNIGIIHNREFEEGVLKIEFYEEDASLRAVDLLTQCRYTVYHR